MVVGSAQFDFPIKFETQVFAAIPVLSVVLFTSVPFIYKFEVAPLKVKA